MTGPSALVPLGDRTAALQWTRVVIGAVVLLASTSQAVVGAPDGPLARTAVAYVAATSAVELLRRALRRRALPVVSGLLLVDGLFLALVVAETGGSASRLLFLVHVHVVAAAVLASFRSGVVAATWHGALLLATGYAGWIGDVPTHPSEADAFAIGSFFLVATGAVLVARLNEGALRRSRWAADTLVQLGSEIERARRGGDVAMLAADHLVHRLGYRRAAVLVAGASDWGGALTDDHGTFPVVAAGATTGSDQLTGPTPAPHLDPDLEPSLAVLLPGARHVVMAPLMTDGRFLGVLAVECGEDRTAVSTDELALLAATAERAALALRAAALLAEVERLAASDALTGLPNRRLFDEVLDAEVARALRSGAPLAVALIDVDHFKAVNDRHGHHVGDEVLRQLAAALRGAARTESLVARYGGEEFVVILPDATLAQATIAADRLRTAARQVTAVPVTISVGVAALPAEGDGGAMGAAADAALYRAKAGGRDRVVCDDGDPDRIIELSGTGAIGGEPVVGQMGWGQVLGASLDVSG